MKRFILKLFGMRPGVSLDPDPVPAHHNDGPYIITVHTVHNDNPPPDRDRAAVHDDPYRAAVDNLTDRFEENAEPCCHDPECLINNEHGLTLLQFSNKEIFIYAVIALGLTYPAVLSSLFYLDLGEEGAKELPVGKFNPSLVARSCFICNTALNFAYMMETVLALRTGWYDNRLRRSCPVLPKTAYWKRGFKWVVAIILAGLSASLMGWTAADSQSVMVQYITGAVNFVMFLLCAGAMCDFLISLRSSVKSLSPQRLGLIPALLHLFGQLGDKLSLIGFSGQTLVDICRVFSPSLTCTPQPTYCTPPHLLLPFGVGQQSVGVIALHQVIIWTFIALTTRTVFNTVQDIIDTPAAVRQMLQGKSHRVAALILSFFLTALAACTLFSYLSAATTIALLTRFNCSSPWITYPSCIGLMLFNAYGLNQIGKWGYQIFSFFRLNKGEQHDKVKDNFFERHPDARDKHTSSFLSQWRQLSRRYCPKSNTPLLPATRSAIN